MPIGVLSSYNNTIELKSNKKMYFCIRIAYLKRDPMAC